MSQGLLVSSAEFWRSRLNQALASERGLYSAIFDTDPETWRLIEVKTSRRLNELLPKRCRVLDAGCGYGTIYSYLPKSIDYLGIDISPDLIEIARMRQPAGDFRVGNLANLPEFQDQHFDYTICRAIKPMIIRELGEAVWQPIERELTRVSKQVIYLEYQDLSNRSNNGNSV